MAPMENVDDIYPLSPMQRLMLMHSIRVPGSSTLSNQFRYRVSGKLDVARFESAWQRAIDRHPALRSAFVWEGVDEPLQVVRSRVRMPIEHVALDERDADNPAEALAQLEQADREQGFDLTRAPLMRMTVITLGDDEHVVLWSRHHLILDLWSVELLFDEVFRHYGTAELPLDDAPGFRDYVAWLGGQDHEAAEAHYRRNLDGLAAPSLLFGQRARRSEWSPEGQAVAERVLAAERVAAVTEFARTNGLTFGSVVQGAVGMLIAERLRRDDIVYGLTVAGRPSDLESVESILGTFINDVPVRLTVDRAMLLADWLKDLQAEHAARQPFEYLSPIDVHRCSGLPADRPLFDLLLLLQAPGATAKTGPTEVTLEALRGPFDSALPMTLAVEQEGDAARLTAVYDDSVVADGTAEEILAALAGWLERIPEHGHVALGELLPEADEPKPEPRAAARSSSDAVPKDAAETLLDIWRRTLGIDDIGLDDDFFALGATSVQAAIAFTDIERRLGRDLPLSILFNAGNVRALLAVLEEPAEPPSSLVTIQRLGSRPPVLACSGIGGNVIGMAGIARALGDVQPFFGLQPAGVFDEAEQAHSVEDLAAAFIAASEEVRDTPFVLLGVCFGANVMLDMARQLSEAGRPPSLLIVVDPVHDDGDAPRPAGREPGLAGFLRDRLRLYAEEYRSLEPGEFRPWLGNKAGTLWNKIRHRDLLRGNRFEMRQRRLEAANIAAAGSYVPRPYDGRTRVLITADRDVGLPEDPRFRWIKVVSPEANVATVPGSDTGDALGQHAAVVADRLRRWIDELV